MRIFNSQRAAECLAFADLYGDAKASEKYSISERTVRAYRRRSRENLEFEILVERCRQDIRGKWVDYLPGTLIKTMDFIERATSSLDASKPESLMAVTDALKTIANVIVGKAVIDMGLEGSNSDD